MRWFGLLSILAMTCLSVGSAVAGDDDYLAGYLILPTNERVDKAFGFGYSMYVPAWSLLQAYPGHRFQTGLPGTWMFAQYDGPAPKDMYSDVEGGLGWWTDTRFPTATPKFIMGGVDPNFSEIANGPAHGAGSWEQPKGLYGVAQLSPWLLFPLDGLNLKQGSRGDFLGYGYLNLPLLDAKPKTDGKEIPTGKNCWTLFLNSSNFKGPVAFFTPYFWSHTTVKEPRLAGQLLDSRPSDPNRAIQMETQYIPCKLATDSTGESYARVDPASFPLNRLNASALIHQSTTYDQHALWDSVKEWFEGGPASEGAVDPQGAHILTFTGRGGETWHIRTKNPDGSEKEVPLDWSQLGHQVVIDPHTFGYEWNFDRMKKSADGRLVSLPEYFHLQKGPDGKAQKWVAIAADRVPTETGLQKIVWSRPEEPAQEPYETPKEPSTSWKTPGPAAGPFQAKLGDGTTVTYYWYRFADQPALLNAGLTRTEREQLQLKVEKLHRAWPRTGNYLNPPEFGNLALIDPALIVKPPKGMEYGYVPIATRQALTAR